MWLTIWKGPSSFYNRPSIHFLIQANVQELAWMCLKMCRNSLVKGNFFNFQVKNILYWQFHSKNEIPINYLFTKRKWIYIYIEFWTLKLRCIQYGYCGLGVLQECKDNFFLNSGGRAAFSVRFMGLPTDYEWRARPLSYGGTQSLYSSLGAF